MPVQIAKVNYRGWANSYRLSNDVIDLVVTTDVGPRIIRCGFVNDENEFKEFPDQVGRTGGDEWRIYGGHRFWHAPEDPHRTYFPDNSTVACEQVGDLLRLIQPVEPTTGIQKEIDILLSPDSARVRGDTSDAEPEPVERGAGSLGHQRDGGRRNGDPAAASSPLVPGKPRAQVPR